MYHFVLPGARTAVQYSWRSRLTRNRASVKTSNMTSCVKSYSQSLFLKLKSSSLLFLASYARLLFNFVVLKAFLTIYNKYIIKALILEKLFSQAWNQCPL